MIAFVYKQTLTKARYERAQPHKHSGALPGSASTSSRLLKKSFASTGKDGIVAVVEGQLNLDRAVVLEFG